MKTNVSTSLSEGTMVEFHFLPIGTADTFQRMKSAHWISNLGDAISKVNNYQCFD